MELESVNYQCPSCGGPLRYDGAKGLLVCDHCESQFEVADIEGRYAAREQAEASKAQTASAEVLEGGYVCSSCGAELVTDGTTAVSECPYCGNPVVMESNISGGLAPDLVVPFKLSHDDAVAALQKHYKHKPLLPGSFKAGNRINKVQGVYVPFWLYDANASGSATYEATRERRFYQSDDEVIETEHYNVYRAGHMAFEKVPVDGSSKMPDGHMDSIEPFDYRALAPFSTAYMPGFMANRWDEDAEACRPRAEARITSSVENTLQSTVTGYDTVRCTGSDVDCSWGETRYAMLPVWMLHTSWNNKSFLFAMNGQTGRLVGDLPISKPKLVGFLAIIAAAFFFLMWALVGIPQSGGEWAGFVLVPVVAAILGAVLLVSPMRSAKKAVQADRYLDTQSFELTGRQDSYTHTTRQVIHHEQPARR